MGKLRSEDGKVLAKTTLWHAVGKEFLTADHGGWSYFSPAQANSVHGEILEVSLRPPGLLQSMGSQRVRQTEQLIFSLQLIIRASQVALVEKNLPTVHADSGSIPGSGRFPGGGNGNPLWYSYQENPHGQRSLVG